MRTRLSSTIALDLPSSVASPQSLVDGSPTALALSPRLHNNDLAPTKTEGRRWGRYSIFALWTNDVHNIANYSFAMGLYALGLNGWQILLSLGIGAALVFIFMNLSGYMGQRTGVPFPVISRISFGIHGAQIPALIRAVIAIAWFGIQTYLASVVLRVLLIAVHPGFATYDHDSILGLSSLGWVSFVAIWFLQLAILAYGMEMVRRYEGFAGPVILLTVIICAFGLFAITVFAGRVWCGYTCPQSSFTWLCFGSEGRREQTLHTEDKGQGRHDDRTQTHTARLDRSIHQASPLFMQ